MAKAKVTAPAVAQDSVNVGEFLQSHGLLFEMNRTVLMPLGLALYVHDGELKLQDDRDNPEGITYDPAQFAEGRAKWYGTVNDWGYAKHQARKATLGYVAQEG